MYMVYIRRLGANLTSDLLVFDPRRIYTPSAPPPFPKKNLNWKEPKKTDLNSPMAKFFLLYYLRFSISAIFSE